MATKNQPNETIAQNTIAGIDTWLALVDLMGQESKVLPKVNKIRSAAVTIIIRFTRDNQTVHLNMLKKKNELTSDVDLIHTVLGNDSQAEILFIKRSVNPHDRWSGHVALPGGRQEQGELLVETAKRETKEEVGLDLDSSDYVYLGFLDDRYTSPISSHPFLISTQIFLQMGPPSVGFSLDPSEVAACRWIPISTFFQPTLTPVNHHLHLAGGRGSHKSCSIGSLSFPGILLPTTGEEIFPKNDANRLNRDPYVYHLWGITLDIIEDLCARLGFCDRGSFSYMPTTWNPLVRLYLAYQYFAPHPLKSATVWGGIALAGVAISAGAWVVCTNFL